MKKILSTTIIALIVLIGLTVSVNAAAVTTQEGFMTAVENKEKFSIAKDITIVLENDITIANEVTIGAFSGKGNTVTLDLNGHTVKFDGSSAYFYVQNTGTLEIKDSVGGGKITNAGATNSKSYIIQVKGNIIINGGTIENAIASKTALYIQNGDKKQATCVLNEGTILNSYDKSGRAIQVGKDATFTMNGGKVINKATGTAGTVPAIEGQSGKIIINGGTIESEGTGIYSTVEVLITGGTIDAGWFAFEGRDITVAPAEGKTVKVSAGEITEDAVAKEKAAIFKTMGKAPALPDAKNEILGGEFKAPRVIATSSLDDENAVISGGTFTADVSEYLDEDAIYAEDEDGNMTVFVPVELDAPANLKWDETTAKWDAVSNATGYTVILYNGDQIIEVFSLKDTKLDLNKYITKEDGKYNFAVFAEGDGKVYLDSQIAASEVYVFPTEGGEGTAEQQPEEDKKDETPKTGAMDIALYVLGAIALVSVVGTVKAKKPGKYSK